MQHTKPDNIEWMINCESFEKKIEKQSSQTSRTLTERASALRIPPKSARIKPNQSALTENEIANAKKIANCFGVIFLLVNKV